MTARIGGPDCSAELRNIADLLRAFAANAEAQPYSTDGGRLMADKYAAALRRAADSLEADARVEEGRGYVETDTV